MKLQDAIEEIKLIQKYNYTLAPQELFDMILDGLNSLYPNCKYCKNYKKLKACKNCYDHDCFEERGN